MGAIGRGGVVTVAADCTQRMHIKKVLGHLVAFGMSAVT